MGKRIYLYNIIWEVSFLRVMLTLIFTTVIYRDTLNELKYWINILLLIFLFSFLFIFFQNIYKKKKIIKFKNEFKNENICIYNMISLKRKVPKIVIFRLKHIFTEQKYTYNREIKLIWFELIRIKNNFTWVWIWENLFNSTNPIYILNQRSNHN